MSFIRRHSGSVVWSVALHIAIAAGLAMSIRLPTRPRVAMLTKPIDGVLVDGAALEREAERKQQVAREEVQRKQREDRERRQAAEAREREQAAAERREQERVAEEKRLKDQQERDRVAAQKREQERAENEKREQQAREQREREEKAKREREAAAKRRQQQAESELQEALAAENERLQAERSGLLDQYIRMIEDKIVRNWNQPLSVKPGLDCIVNVVQLPTGDVISADVVRCNGDPVVVRSIERAVMDASPLPKPPVPSLFDRNLTVRFHPEL